MRNTGHFPTVTPPELEGSPAFNVVIIYEDFETGKHAKKTYDYLVEHLGHECQFNNQMWKFDVLAVPKLREIAAKDAAMADIIIVAAHGTSDLPAEVKRWIDLWLAEKTRAIALVGLFDAEEYLHNPARACLAAAASRAGMQFFSQPGLWPPREMQAPGFGAWERNGKTFSVLATLTQHDEDNSHWGINE